MKRLIFGMLLGVFLFFSVDDARATTNLEVDYQTSKNSVEIKWESNASYYQLFNGDELIWEGKADRYKQNELTPETQYKYFLFALNKDKQVIDKTEIRVMTKGDNKKIRGFIKSNSPIDGNKLDGITIDAIISKDKVKVKWDEYVPDEDGIVELYRNGKFIDEIEGNEYLDKNIEPDKYYTYNVIGKEKRADNEIKQEIGDLESKGYKITDELLEEVSYERFDLGKIVKTFSLEDLNITNLAEAKAYATASLYPHRFNFRYTTFIADNTVGIPGNPLTCPTFQGDNRSFAFNHSRYRTQAEVTVYINGTTTTKPKWEKRSIGQSKRYNCDGTTDTTTQTNYTMSLSTIEATKQFAEFRVTHAVGDPFPIIGVNPPVIDYTYTASVNQYGDIIIGGSHDQAPHHEMYVYIPGSEAMLTIFNHKSKGLQYLAPGTTKAKVDFKIFN